LAKSGLLLLIPASGHRIGDTMSFSSMAALDLWHFFLANIYSKSRMVARSCLCRLGPGASDINAPNKPSYGDNIYEEETPHCTAYNGSDVGSLTLFIRGSGHFTVGVESIMNAILSVFVFVAQIIVDWEVVLIQVVTTPGPIRLDELEQLA
jgi:hypothetical protein